jgi:hypothetical protein
MTVMAYTLPSASPLLTGSGETRNMVIAFTLPSASPLLTGYVETRNMIPYSTLETVVKDYTFYSTSPL